MTTPAPSAATRPSRPTHGATMCAASPAFASSLAVVFVGWSAVALAQVEAVAKPEAVANANQSVVAAPDGSRNAQVTASGCLATESDFVRANGMRPLSPGVDLSSHVVIIDDAGKVFSVNGTRERDLLTRVGSRVEVSGTLEGWWSDVSLERLPEDVPLGGSHEPSDASVARVEGPVLTPPALRPINVRSFRAVDGDCVPLLRTVDDAKTAARDDARPAVARIAAASPMVERVRVQGCVLRDPSGSDRLVLSQIVIRRPDVVSSAVPGSLPSGSGTGTTPAPRAVPTTGSTQAFYLVGQDKLTTVLLGSRAEIVGTLAVADAVPSARGTGHTSAPVRPLTVEAVRSIGGGCAP